MKDLDATYEVLEELTSTAFDLVDRITDLVQEPLDHEGPLRRGELTTIDAHVREELERADTPLVGAGFVAAVGVLEDAEWWLEWFARDADNKVQQLIVQSDPNGMGFYDYEHLPWYAVPRNTGVRHVTGPYVDYLCTEDYTLTFTAPVIAQGRFVGVAGGDVGVPAAEQRLLPVLRKAERGVAVVNAFGRILASNSGRHLCGDLVAEGDELAKLWANADEANAPIRVLPGLPLAVVALDAFTS